MIKIVGFLVSLFLILIIFLRVPKENGGLTSFAMKTNFLGSPSSSERAVNILTGFGIFIYFVIAIILNFLNH